MADVLDDGKSGKASAYSVDEVLVESAGVDANALHKDWVILGSFLAFSTDTVDGQEALLAVAEVRVDVEDLVGSAAVAHGVCAPVDFYGGWLAPGAIILIVAVAVVVRESANRQEQH